MKSFSISDDDKIEFRSKLRNINLNSDNIDNFIYDSSKIFNKDCKNSELNQNIENNLN